MNSERADVLWLDEHHEVSFSELAESSGLSDAELRELVDYGALVPTNLRSVQWTFSGDCVVAVRTACRLRNDFELDPQALALALKFIVRIRELEAQLRDLRAQLPHRSP
jgi:chaperone modulatory protein CbpM